MNKEHTKNVYMGLTKVLVSKVGDNCGLISVFDERSHFDSDLNKVGVLDPERTVLIEVTLHDKDGTTCK